MHPPGAPVIWEKIRDSMAEGRSQGNACQVGGWQENMYEGGG